MRISLFKYLIKGCRATPCEQLVITKHGPEDCRAFTFAEAEEPLNAVTQRRDPELVFIQPTMLDAGLRIETVPGAPTKMSPILVSRDAWEANVCTARQVLIHKKAYYGVDQGDEVADWISTYLGRRVRLYYMPNLPDRFRRVPSRVPEGVESSVKFADSHSLLLTTYVSLVELNRQLPPQYEPFSMSNFRPNIVVDSEDEPTKPEPWIEETWRRFNCGEVVLHGVKLCTRCVVVSTNQQTGERQDFKLLAAMTQIHSAESKGKAVPVKGMYLVPGSEGVIHDRDRIGNITFGPRPEL